MRHTYSKAPKDWGGSFWYVLFSIAHNYPEEPTVVEMTNAMNCYQSMESLLPCRKCKNNYTTMLNAKHPITWLDVQDRKSLIKWVEVARAMVSHHEAESNHAGIAVYVLASVALTWVCYQHWRSQKHDALSVFKSMDS